MGIAISCITATIEVKVGVSVALQIKKICHIITLTVYIKNSFDECDDFHQTEKFRENLMLPGGS